MIGTGKTLIAKAIAAQTNVNFVSINATDILSSFYGESEQKVRTLIRIMSIINDYS